MESQKVRFAYCTTLCANNCGGSNLTPEFVQLNDFTAKELEKCLTKCAELTSKNTKLARRLREEKDANKNI